MMKALRTPVAKLNEMHLRSNLLQTARCLLFVFAYFCPTFYPDRAIAEQINLECVGTLNTVYADGSIRYRNYETTQYIELDLDEKKPSDSKVRLTDFLGMVFQNKIRHSLCDKNHPCSNSFQVDDRRIIGTLLIDFPSVRNQQSWNLNLDRVSGRVTYGFRNWNANGPTDGNGFSGQCRKKMREF